MRRDRPIPLLGLVAAALLLAPLASGEEGAGDGGPWRHDPRAGGERFPIAVWLQSPDRAEQYKRAGFNLFVGLWKGPTEEQLAALRRAGMQVICSQNEVGLRHRNDPTIVGWMHQDEPDNAQARKDGDGYDPPITPAEIVEGYERMRQADPTRPILLNLGQGVAWDGWKGRGTRTNHPEDYPGYVQGADLVSFDIYPVVHRSPDVSGNITFIGRGIDRLRDWTEGRKHVWNCIECTRIKNPEVKPSPAQVRAEVWLSLIHGSQGLIYFVHEWEPGFNEKALLDDPVMLAAVTTTNREIHALARVINSEVLPDAATVTAPVDGEPIHITVRSHGGHHHVLTVNTLPTEVKARISLSRAPPASLRVQVLGEQRSLRAQGGSFEDTFAPWEVHLYRARLPRSR